MRKFRVVTILTAALLTIALVPSALAASPPTLQVTVQDASGNKVASAVCAVTQSGPQTTFTDLVTNSGGQATVSEPSADISFTGVIDCTSGRGVSFGNIYTLAPGVTKITVTVT